MEDVDAAGGGRVIMEDPFGWRALEEEEKHRVTVAIIKECAPGGCGQEE